ncbi:MAG TPA: S9 family peptidase [Bryobacteraceae bacterium]|nr:S9 family peptidase [Bryobacteraceae bacterium]
MPRSALPIIVLVLAPLSPAAAPTLPVPANLTAEDIPAIPAGLMEEIAPYTEFRTAALLDWHPVRREILISTRFGQAPQIHRVMQPGGARTQLTFYADRVLGGSYSPDGNSFLFAKDIGGGEWYQVYNYDTRTGRAALLTDGKSRNTSAIWSRDGSHIAYASTKRNGRDTDIYVAVPSHPEEARMIVEADSGGWAPEDFSPDGKALAVFRSTSAYEGDLYLVDTASGQRSPLMPHRAEVIYRHARFSPDGGRVYLLTNQDSDFEHLALLDLATRKLTILRPEMKWDVSSFDLTRDGRRLAYIVNDNGSDTLHVMETASQREMTLPHLPYGSIGNVVWHANGHDLGFTITSARTPSDVYSVEVDSGQLDRWTYGETGGLDASQFSEPELIQWKSFDGLTISGFLYPPPKRFTGPRPVIVNIHGGPEGQFQPGYLGTLNYLLSELGTALIFPNVRGSSGYGKTFLNLDNGRKREDSVKDIGALLDWVPTRSDLDGSRVMVTGGSYGGYMTLASMTHFNARFRCAVDIVGISNWVTFLEHTEAYRRDLRRVEYGDERDPQMRAFLESISPVTHVDKITKPMFIVAGRNDPRVPYTEGQQMAAAMRARGVPVWYLLAADEGHGFAKKSNRDFQFAATVLFVRKYLEQAP